MATRAIYPVIPTRDLKTAHAFYQRLLDLTVTFESDWYISFVSPTGAQLGLVQADHPSIPEAHRQRPEGTIITVEVESATALYDRAQAMERPIALSLRDEAWGQRHFMAVDPDGLLVDVVEIIPPSGEFAEQYTETGRELLD